MFVGTNIHMERLCILGIKKSQLDLSSRLFETWEETTIINTLLLSISAYSLRDQGFHLVVLTFWAFENKFKDHLAAICAFLLFF